MTIDASSMTVIAHANMPPQGYTFSYSNMTKYKWEKRLFPEQNFINPLVFVLQMVKMCIPI
jgi:hypothetical protein